MMKRVKNERHTHFTRVKMMKRVKVTHTSLG